jgi:hypothetical protein
VPKKNSTLKNNWPRNDANANANEDDDPYEAPVLAYSREMDQLVEVNIISNEVEEDDCKTCPYGGMMKLDDEEKKHGAQGTMPKRCHDG